MCFLVWREIPGEGTRPALRQLGSHPPPHAHSRFSAAKTPHEQKLVVDRISPQESSADVEQVLKRAFSTT